MDRQADRTLNAAQEQASKATDQLATVEEAWPEVHLLQVGKGGEAGAEVEVEVEAEAHQNELAWQYLS